MNEPAPRRPRWQRLLRLVPLLAAVAVLLVALVLVSDVEREAAGASRQYLWVLILTVIALATLALAIIHRLLALARRVREGTPGARLAARWVRNFVLLSLPPALIVYGFSVHFLTRTVDSWFDVEVETALADSLELGQQFLDLRTLEARNRLQSMGRELAALQDDREALRQALTQRVSRQGPVELSVLERDGSVIATAAFDPDVDVGGRADDFALLQAFERGEYAAAEPGGDGTLGIRVIRRLPETPGEPEAYLQAAYPLPRDFTALAGNVEREYHRYQNLAFLRSSLKQSFVLILTLVLGLTLLLAILAALNTARRQVKPLSRLAAATGEVAGGRLDRQVRVETRDELGFLASSFNDMTRALVRASETAEARRAQLQAQGEYLETVLGSLSAGVLTLDRDGRVVTANAAADAILALPEGASGSDWDALIARAPWLAPLAETVAGRATRDAWQQEVHLVDAEPRRVLLVRGSRLPGEDGGQVVVFDDVTVLNQAQRDAAWSEVAQRLAHEVRNPLTPIRLAAERLRMKLMDRLEPGDAEVVDRAATTIVAQVEALKTLVDAFGDYARDPELDLEPLALGELVDEVAGLYRQGSPELDLALDLAPDPAGLVADAGRIRQLLHNLIRNASEAAEGSRPSITIRTGTVTETDRAWLRLEVEDEGPGFPAEVLDQPFEPRVSHKAGGRGLGLAICRKIVAEHDGRITLENPPRGGARVRVLLPLRRRRGETAVEAGGGVP